MTIIFLKKFQIRAWSAIIWEVAITILNKSPPSSASQIFCPSLGKGCLLFYQIRADPCPYGDKGRRPLSVLVSAWFSPLVGEGCPRWGPGNLAGHHRHMQSLCVCFLTLPFILFFMVKMEKGKRRENRKKKILKEKNALDRLLLETGVVTSDSYLK